MVDYATMFAFLKKKVKTKTFPIGVDLGTNMLKVAQLGSDDSGLFVIGAGSEQMPEHLEVGSGKWQRWTAEALKRLTHNGMFHGRDVITAMSVDEVFIEQMKVSKRPGQKLDEVILANIQNKLSFSADDALVRYVVTSERANNSPESNSSKENGIANRRVWENGKAGTDVNVVVMATERVKVDRHLAIYENAHLEVKQIGVWPLALAKSYVTFFGRRQNDTDKIAMLIQIGANFTNVVICRGGELLFARLIPMGLKKLGSAEMANRLVLELSACEHYFESLSGANRIERLVYLSGQNSDKNICDNLAQVARRRHIPAQLADVFGAVRVQAGISSSFDRRNCKVNWATAFGLSLS